MTGSTMSPDRHLARCAVFFATISLCLWTSSALAQTGVSEDRVSLPEGPGSLEGVGENVGINTNMGSMSYSVDIKVPQGFPDVTPSLGLSYSSAGGESLLGVGWSMSMPSIERMTFKRLPLYQDDDDFCVGGSDQLVRLPGTNPPVYRARYESGFVRYTWMESGDGSEGYWIAEYPNGSKGYFGADSDGNLVAEARVGHAAGTFKYLMVDKVDVYGHKITWTYQKFGNYALPTHIGYVFKEGVPTYEVEFVYNERMDNDGVAYISVADGGFELLLTQRLARLDIKSRGVRIRAYQLSYEPYGSSGGFTHLSKVETLGAQGDTYPIVFDFEYSQSLGSQCQGDACTEPYMADMGSLGITLASGSATLIDINGDALPDVLDTSQPGSHRFYINIAQVDGGSAFNSEAVVSAVGRQDNHRLGSPGTQILDANGDGFADILNAGTGSILFNKGKGDWEVDTDQLESANLAAALNEDFDVEDGGLQDLRFIDFNNDKKIDLMRASRAQTTLFENMGENFDIRDEAQSLGAGFSEDNLQLADMNGDGQLDIVKVQLGSIRYRLNFGWGNWSDWVDISGLPIGEGQIEQAELEDINGDALADLVVVVGESVTYALNNNSTTFDDPIQLTSSDVAGSIPNRGAEVNVLYADMNANGSSDVVWIGPSGQVDYLELFPVRPNLMTKITNAIGQVTDISYGTIAVEMARDGGIDAWEYRLPSPMNVVKRLDKYDLLTNLHEITEYDYHDGYYDGEEKQFRGFERVETRLLGDATIEEGMTEEMYDVGADDTYRNGLLLSSRVFSEDRELNETRNVYGECPVAEIPESTAYPIKHICQTGTENVIKEGMGEDRWIMTRGEYLYDGYGNVTRSEEHGIISVGGGGCGACGPDRGPDDFGEPCDRGGDLCMGDEMFTETGFVEPGEDTNGRWITGAAFRERSWGRDGSPLQTENLTYYDGPAFEGMPLGQLDQGKVSRSTTKIAPDSDDVIMSGRYKHDTHGNVIETLDPLGEPDGNTHRRTFLYDVENLRVVQADLLLEDKEGQAYRLRREVLHEPLFDKPFEATDWLRVVDGQVVSAIRGFVFTYDQFGRLTSRILPGNTSNAPDEAYQYDLQSPTSRIIINKRSQVGQEFDIELIKCIDGRGRDFQSKTRLEEGRYQVSGFKRFNIRSSPVEIFQPYTSNSAMCDTAPPEGTLSRRFRYDASYRNLVQTLPDGGIYDAPSVLRSAYEPLVTLLYDAEDTDATSPHFNTPTVTRVNGMGNLVTIDRHLLPEQSAQTQVHYDSLGRVTGYTDPDGNRKEQFYDLPGRVIRNIDPNTAEGSTFVYDDAGNMIRRTDARGITMVSAYDGLNRPWSIFDAANPEETRIEMDYDVAPDCPECTNAEAKLVSVSWPGADGGRDEDRLGYDLRKRITTTSRRLMGVPFVFTMRYDNVDRRLSTTYPDGSTVDTRFDDASRITGVGSVVRNINYNERSLRADTECGDGTRSTMRYDDLMRLDEVRTSTPGGDVLQGFGYNYDRQSNILNIMDLATADRANTPIFDAEHTYDAWYRTITSRYGSGAEVLNFGFDALDNITDVTSSLGEDSEAHVGDMSYDSFAPNAVTEAGGVLMGYDQAGNLIERGEQRYQWDFLGRMTGARSATQEPLARFVYGGNQSRVAKFEGDSATLYASSDFEVRDGISSLYVKVGTERVARIESDALATAIFEDQDGDGSISASDALLTHQGGGAPGPVLWSNVRRLLLETGPDNGTTYLHQDHLGSFTLATGEVEGAHTVLGHRNFTPLGSERSDGWGYVDEYGFTGQEIDRSTGLIHFDYRYYDPRVGRWLSIDPAFNNVNSKSITKYGEATTAYAYVAGNFINAHDPTGLVTKRRKARITKGIKSSIKKRRKKLKPKLDAVKAKYADKPTMVGSDGSLTMGLADRIAKHNEMSRITAAEGSSGEAIVRDIGVLSGDAAKSAATMITDLLELGSTLMKYKHSSDVTRSATMFIDGKMGGDSALYTSVSTREHYEAVDFLAVSIYNIATGSFARGSMSKPKLGALGGLLRSIAPKHEGTATAVSIFTDKVIGH